MLKKTALYDTHVRLGGKMVEFAGYSLPVQYSGILEEHKAVRTAAGLFDVSHMGEFLFRGVNAESALNALLTNDIRGMRDGQVRYSLLPNERGGAVDDVLVYRENGECFWLVVNGANVAKDAAWVREHIAKDGVQFYDRSDDFSQIALQGPASEKILSGLVGEEGIPRGYYTFLSEVKMRNFVVCVSRTGYTGEDGFEIYCMNAVAEQVYDLLLEAGEPYGLIPCGLGARDTLRLEAGMPLYGHELAEDIPVDETGLGFAIKLGKEDFVGKAAIQAHTPEYARIGAKVRERGIVREHCDIYCGDELVGVSTSGTHSPTLGYGICMLRVKRAYVGAELTADVRGRRIALDVVPLPFYKRAK